MHALLLPLALQPEELKGRLLGPATAGLGMDCYQQHPYDHLHGMTGVIKHLCMPDSVRRKKRLVAERAAARAASTATTPAAPAAARAAATTAAAALAAPQPAAATAVAAAAAPRQTEDAAPAVPPPPAAVSPSNGESAAPSDDEGAASGDEDVAADASEAPLQWGDREEEGDEEVQGNSAEVAAALPGVSMLEWCLLPVSNRRRMNAIKAVSCSGAINLSYFLVLHAARLPAARWLFGVPHRMHCRCGCVCTVHIPTACMCQSRPLCTSQPHPAGLP